MKHSALNFAGDVDIPATREQVWRGLNDTEVLAACIGACESIEWLSDHELRAKFRVKFGIVSPTFLLDFSLSDIQAPHSYTLSGEGGSALFGNANGQAAIVLSDNGSDTLLRYQIDVVTSGKLATIGAQLMSGTAQKMITDFFERFSRQIQ